jgi:acyl carrier protein
MTRQNIIEGLRELLRRHESLKVDVSTITEATRIDDVGFDSLSILDFMYDVESRFGIRLEASELIGMQVVRDLVDHVESRVPA